MFLAELNYRRENKVGMNPQEKSFTLFDGRKEHHFSIPARKLIAYQVQAEPQPVSDIGAELLQQLSHPIAAVPLAEQIKPGMRILILADDYTRPTPAHQIVPPLLDELNRLGIPDKQISLLVAAGHHREMTREERKCKYGEASVRRIAMFHHHSQDQANMVYIGRSGRGLEVYVNRRAVEADFTVGLGVVEAHPWAGFAGGGKIVNPGIAGKQTIDQTHALPILPEVGIGRAQDNPFWQTSAESAEMLGLSLLINCIMDIKERVIALAAGKPRQTQLALIQKYLDYNQLFFAEPADIVLTTAYPKYQQWGQTAISLYTAARIVKPGGVRITLSACPEGVGDCPHEAAFYQNSLNADFSSPRDYWDRWLGPNNCHSRNTCAIYRHLCDLEHSESIIVSENLPADLRHQRVYKTLDEALAFAYNRCGRDARFAVYDMGGMVLVSL